MKEFDKEEEEVNLRFMPESKCWDCGESKWKPTTTALQTWELQHHINSATVNDKGERLHRCRGFQEYDDEKHKPVGHRIYNYDTLAEEETY